VIRNGIAQSDYGVRPDQDVIEDLDLEDFSEAIDTVRLVLENPNPEDNDFGSFIGQVAEDMLEWDAGVWEYVENPVDVGNPWLGLYPIAGYTIARNKDWRGDPNQPRWAQVIESKVEVEFLHSQLEYVMQRKRTWKPFGVSQLESSIDIMEAWLGVTSYQREIASNAYPPIWIYLGEDASDDQVKLLRTFFEQEMVGKGIPRVFGNTGSKPATLNLKPAGDDGLYLRYQEMLMRSIAFSFDLKPQDFGIERDINRSTAMVGRSQSIDEARRPLALLLQKRINTRIIPRIAEITGNPLIGQLEFFWIGLDPTDDVGDAMVHVEYLKTDVVTIDEVRSDLDLPPLPNGIGKMTLTALQEWAKTDMGQTFIDDLDTQSIIGPDDQSIDEGLGGRLIAASRALSISSRSARMIFGRPYRARRSRNNSYTSNMGWETRE
jgi:hypothetical protein